MTKIRANSKTKSKHKGLPSSHTHPVRDSTMPRYMGLREMRETPDTTNWVALPGRSGFTVVRVRMKISIEFRSNAKPSAIYIHPN